MFISFYFTFIDVHVSFVYLEYKWKIKKNFNSNKSNAKYNKLWKN